VAADRQGEQGGKRGSGGMGKERGRIALHLSAISFRRFGREVQSTASVLKKPGQVNSESFVSAWQKKKHVHDCDKGKDRGSCLGGGKKEKRSEARTLAGLQGKNRMRFTIHLPGGPDINHWRFVILLNAHAVKKVESELDNGAKAMTTNALREKKKEKD